MFKRKKGEHYVDNKVFLQAMIEWRENVLLLRIRQTTATCHKLYW